jgi:hypothetical protein
MIIMIVAYFVIIIIYCYYIIIIYSKKEFNLMTSMSHQFYVIIYAPALKTKKL